MASSSSPKPSYHLCPDFCIAPPPDGHLTLGSILQGLDVDGVAHPLNLNATIDIPAENIFPRSGADSKTGFTRTLKELRSVDTSIWAKVFSLQGLGGTFNFLSNRTADESLTVKEVQTRYFSPTEEYMARSLELPDVAGFVTVTRKRVPVYMVTGLKVAIGAKLSKVESTTKSVKAEIGASDPHGIVSAGGTGGYTKEDSSGRGFDGSTPFVLGIRVRKIWWEKGIRKTSDKVAGVALDNGAAQDKVSLVSGARFVEDYLVDDGENTDAGEVFVNKTEDLGIETSNWALP